MSLIKSGIKSFNTFTMNNHAKFIDFIKEGIIGLNL